MPLQPHSRVVIPALQGLNFDAAGLMAAEYQRVMKRARDLRQAELEEELAAIKHDPKVRNSIKLKTNQPPVAFAAQMATKCLLGVQATKPMF
jgi:hypothetical protein